MELLRKALQDIASDSTAASTCCATSLQRPVLPDASQAPPDVNLHVGGCVFALHEEVLRLRWPWLYLLLQKLRKNGPIRANGTQFQLQLLCTNTQKDARVACPLQTITLLKPLLYTKCLSAQHQRHPIQVQDSSTDSENEQEIADFELQTARKRTRERLTSQENQWGGRPPEKKRARKLFGAEMADVMMAEKPNEVVHVEVIGATAVAMIPVVEYVYTFKVRLLHESSARETLKLAQWVGMGDRIRYSCLQVAVSHVTLETWMELLVATAALTKEGMRRNVYGRLVDFLNELQPVQYEEAKEKIQTVWLQVIDDHEMLVRVVVALINNVRLVGFWRDLLDELVKWIKKRFESPQMPSLRAMHQHFVTDWEPYVEISRLECFTTTSSANSTPFHATLFEFGEFALQACINAAGPSPLLWRVIRRSSPNFFSDDPEEVAEEALTNDPKVRIRGQLVVKYQPADRGGGVVTEETKIEYQHSRHQYCKWKTLVSPTPLTSVRTTKPSDEGWVHYEDPVHNYYRRTVCTVSGKLYLWGDPICSLYHQLLQTTLFCSAPSHVGSEVADILIVSEMQKLPAETLELVLCSDRLRVPEGEKTLLRCLNKMVFGLDVYHLAADAQLPRPNSGSIEDVTRLYRCVRWCFVPLDDLMQVLRWSSRTLKLYELIVESLRDPNRSRKRRRPFGWRKFRDAYMTNETNLSEFEIEAGDLHLAPGMIHLEVHDPD